LEEQDAIEQIFNPMGPFVSTVYSLLLSITIVALVVFQANKIIRTHTCLEMALASVSLSTDLIKIVAGQLPFSLL
jgi:hypothetical protein